MNAALYHLVPIMITGLCPPWDHLASSAGLFGYVGPGAGLSMMGSLLAVACVVLLALLGPLLYPIILLRSLVRRIRSRKDSFRAKRVAPAGAGEGLNIRVGNVPRK